MKSARAPLLLNLLGCVVCGVERRFRAHGKGVLSCEHCGTPIADAAMSAPIPSSSPPPAPRHQPAAAPDSSKPAASGDLPYRYGDPMWGSLLKEHAR